jgi:hypothetical protein
MFQFHKSVIFFFVICFYYVDTIISKYKNMYLKYILNFFCFLNLLWESYHV